MNTRLHDERSFVLGLVGAGIGASLTPAMQVREGRASGLSLSYRRIDVDELGLGPDSLADLLGWARRLGFDGLNITHPFKQEVVPLLEILHRLRQAEISAHKYSFCAGWLKALSFFGKSAKPG